MVVVNLTRSRAENLGNVARGLALLPAGRHAGRRRRQERRRRQRRPAGGAALPLDGAFVKAHGRVFWLTRPAALPPTVAAWARAAEPAAATPRAS